MGTDIVDLDWEIKNVYVFTDIVAARPIGDAIVPLLCTIPILNRTITSVFYHFDKPPLDTFKPVSFRRGESAFT